MKQLIVCFAFILFYSISFAQKSIAEKLVQEQLDAYNKRDIEAFLKPYADSIAIYYFPNQLDYIGKEKMRKDYGNMFATLPDLHCTLKSRIVLGNKIIDEESVVFDKKSPVLHAAVIYTIQNNKIVTVHFVSQ